MGLVPGVNVGARAGLLKPPTGPVVDDLPEIYEASSSDAVPTIALVGASGTGKTEQIRRLIRHLKSKGETALVVAVESKQQVISALNPKILPIQAPGKDGKSVDVTVKYNRLMTLKNAIRDGRFREDKGVPIGVLCFDGVMEVGDIIKGHHTKNMPTSQSSGEKNTFALYDRVGVDQIDFLAALREAAGDAAKAFGTRPLGMVVTCGEEFRNGEFRPILPGNMAPIRFPYQFELVLRLAVEEGVYVAYTKPGTVYTPVQGSWNAKAPDIFGDTRIVNPDLGEIYEKVLAYYQDSTRNEAQGA